MKRVVCFKHKPEPTPWRYYYDQRGEAHMTRNLRCRFCGKPIQRRGLLRRWGHVE